MWRTIAAATLVAALLILLGCGGGSNVPDSPTTGVQAGDGTCNADPQAQAKRASQVRQGSLSKRRSAEAELTEVKTCEIEGEELKLRERVCARDAGALLAEGKISGEAARDLQALQDRAHC